MSRLREMLNNPGDPNAIAHAGAAPQLQPMRIAFNVIGSWTFFMIPVHGQISAFGREEMESVGAKGRKETYQGITLLTVWGHELALDPSDSEAWLNWFEGVSEVQRVIPVSADSMPQPPVE
jgi:hypothetical protein